MIIGRSAAAAPSAPGAPSGQPGQLPPGEVSAAYGVLESEFSAGLLSPVEIVIEGEGTYLLDPVKGTFDTPSGPIRRYGSSW